MKDIFDEDYVLHLNVGGQRGWTTACGIESSNFVEAEDIEEVSCGRCCSTGVYREILSAT